jgi:SAM-dependent MidA family methyltransferase
METEKIIIEKIRCSGPLKFRDFMETALYHPGMGYYNTPAIKIGMRGDYYTSPCYTNIFGELIAKQLIEIILLLNEPKFTIVEYGAGTGILCFDILAYLERERCSHQVEYCILEKSPAMRRLQHKLLPAGVRWIENLHELQGFTGCVLANEVLDNFSVHVVKMEGQLQELYIDYGTGEFEETWRLATSDLVEYFDALDVTLPEGSMAEINLAAIDWIRDISQSMAKGFVITIDYGGTSEELYTPGRSGGTLACFHKHRVNGNYLSDIGQQDITAHVNFSALVHWGAAYGMKFTGFATQANFLRGLGFSAHLRKSELANMNGYGKSIKVDLVKIFFLEMGQKLKVLVLQKGLRAPALSGLQFADLHLGPGTVAV